MEEIKTILNNISLERFILKNPLKYTEEITKLNYKEYPLIMAIRQFYNEQEVYFIFDGKRVKIGKSENPESRVFDLQTGNPKQLELLCSSHYLKEENTQILFQH